MRQVLVYTCEVRGSKIQLRLEQWPVADYPISFTSVECLEEFCHLVGWGFLDCSYAEGIHIFHCNIYTGKLMMDTIYTLTDYYNRRMV